MTRTACRVCGADGSVHAGNVEYLAGMRCAVMDCGTCGCRWTPHDSTVHGRLHQHASISYYADYGTLMDQCRELFARRDLDGIDRLLRVAPKYAFVLDRLQAIDRGRILEWGCSRGYLTARSILAGRDILGVDAATSAIAAAREAFGDHFALPDSERVEAGAPYDAIYHVGLIGCVPDPIGLTRRMLGLLKPGGRMFFNAPNRSALYRRDALWFDSAPPPDVITLFPPGFWTKQFGATGMVNETVEHASAAASTVKTLVRWFGPAWHAPAPHPLESPIAQRWNQPSPATWWRGAEAVAAKLASATGAGLGSWPEEFGLFVELTHA